MEIALLIFQIKIIAEALKWINLYENSNPKDDRVEYAKFLINLNQKNHDLDTIINYLSNNYE